MISLDKIKNCVNIDSLSSIENVPTNCIVYWEHLKILKIIFEKAILSLGENIAFWNILVSYTENIYQHAN